MIKLLTVSESPVFPPVVVLWLVLMLVKECLECDWKWNGEKMNIHRQV